MAGSMCLPPQLPTAEKWIVLNLGICTHKMCTLHTMALLIQGKASCSFSDGSVGNCCRKHAMWRKRAKTQLPSVTHLSSTMWLQLMVFSLFQQSVQNEPGSPLVSKSPWSTNILL